MKRLFIIDGHSLIFRMYYAFIRRPMVNTKGVDTSILYGFTKYLLELIKKEAPTHLAVAFDPPGKTFRHDLYEPYKANRVATPELVKEALVPLIEIVKSLDIPVIMIPGFEADDVIGAAAKRGEQNGYNVYMVTPDKDFGQLLSDNIFQFKPGKSGAENELIGKKEICEKFSICDPLQVIDILSIWGDASDNVPGVRGVGEVGATKLVSKYGSMESILSHLDELPPKQAEAFRTASDHLPLSKQLVTIKTDIPLNFTEEDLRLSINDTQRTRELFAQYEFGSLLPLLTSITDTSATSKTVTPAEAIPPTEKVKLNYKIVPFEAFNERVKKEERVALLLRGERLLLCSGEAIFETRNFEKVSSILENKNIKKIGYDLKSYYNLLSLKGISLNGYLADIELIHYLINPERTHKFDLLAMSYLGVDVNQTDAAPKTVQQLDLFGNELSDQQDSDSESFYIKVSALTPLYDAVNREMTADNSIVELYELIEMPLIRVLGDMEREGFKIDTLMLQEYQKELTIKMDELEEKIKLRADEPSLNLSSPKQLGVLLYEKLALNPKVKKTKKGGYPTDEETLLAIADKDSIIEDILDYRALKKIISTYIEPFPLLIDKRTGKIHTTFNQALTATGRLSSVKPNLQNIPIRTDLGREIRRAFIPSRANGTILSADYSQIELRLMAVLSGDKNMIADFLSGKDIHTATAARVFNISENEVTKEQRRKAKSANFGIIYGISSFGLSQNLHISREESKQIISEYFLHYPDVKAYMESTKIEALEKGYVETICKRKRYLPSISSKNAVVRAIAERNAINAPIQGSAADIIKIAMIRVAAALKEAGLKSRMILQVHDELVFDIFPSEEERVETIVRSAMENVLPLEIPLTAECGIGKNWLEAH